MSNSWQNHIPEKFCHGRIIHPKVYKCTFFPDTAPKIRIYRELYIHRYGFQKRKFYVTAEQ